MRDELPEGWAVATVSAVTLPFETVDPLAAPGQRFTYIDIGTIDNATQSIGSPKVFLGADAPSRARRVVASGDVLFSTVRPYLKNIALVPDHRSGALTSTGICVLRANRHALLPEYLHRVVSTDSFVGRVSRKMDGTLYPAVRDADILESEVLLPPLNEQRRIVAKVEALMARSRRAKEALAAIPPLLDQLRQSILAAAFRGDLTADWRTQHPDVEPAAELLKRIRTERRRRWEQAELAKMKAKGKAPGDDRWKAKYEEPEPVDESELPELPEGWCWESVEALSTKVVDGVHKKPEYVDTGVPFVTVRNLTAGPGIDFKRLNYVTEEDHREFVKRADPERGDILISKDGTLGVVRAVRTGAPFSIFVSVALVKPVRRFQSDYLELALSSPAVQAQMVGVGSGLQHIHLQDLRVDAVPVAPEPEQREVVARARAGLDRVQSLAETAGTQAAAFQALDSAILAKAFRGELVPQDPYDEPASALLERIRAGEDEEPKKKGSKMGRRGKGG